MPNQYAIEMKNIVKKFGDFTANDHINLQVKHGEIHALLGENGAGKSTLMNILSGLLEATAGEIWIDGKKVEIDSPTTANALHIGMVHQHFMLIHEFTVLENIILGMEPLKTLGLDREKARREVQELSDRYGLKIDVDAKVADISIGMQQKVEILKILYRGADYLIFDEPTAVLTPQEINELLVIMKALVAEGKSIILITHKLDEIKESANRCTVIRRGKSIATVDVDTVSHQELAEMMVGRAVSFKTEKTTAKPGEPVLEINNLVVNEARGVARVKGLDLTVCQGEILGVAGIDGNGQTELVKAITGLSAVESGTIRLNSQDITNASPRKITELKVGHVPEDRQQDGLVLEMSVAENIGLQSYYQEPFSKHFFLNESAIKEQAQDLIQEFDIRTTSASVPIKSLSGGNQQKAIIAREIDRDPDLLVVAQPTRGLDVGAIEYIHRRLIEQRDQGKGVLLVSFELEEVLNLSDRIAVIHDGKITGIVNPETTSQQELGLLMAGAQLENIQTEEKIMRGVPYEN